MLKSPPAGRYVPKDWSISLCCLLQGQLFLFYDSNFGNLLKFPCAVLFVIHAPIRKGDVVKSSNIQPCGIFKFPCFRVFGYFVVMSHGVSYAFLMSHCETWYHKMRGEVALKLSQCNRLSSPPCLEDTPSCCIYSFLLQALCHARGVLINSPPLNMCRDPHEICPFGIPCEARENAQERNGSLLEARGCPVLTEAGPTRYGRCRRVHALRAFVHVAYLRP
jgi:hypothetical protein